MSVRKNQQILNRASVAILGAAVGIGIWGWASSGMTLPPIAGINGAVGKQTDKSTGSEMIASQGNDSFSSKSLMNSDVWSRDLQGGSRKRQVVPDNAVPKVPVPPPVNVVTQVKQFNELGLRLVGTVLEKGRSMAIAIDQQGRLDFRAEGELLQLEPEGVRIESVQSNAVHASFMGKEANWIVGQSLRFEGDNATNDSGITIEASSSDTVDDASSSARISPPIAGTIKKTEGEPAAIPVPAAMPVPSPMSIEEELELLNGVPNSDSF